MSSQNAEAAPAARDPYKKDDGVTGIGDYEAILTVIAHGIEVARDNPMPDAPYDADRYAAWCVLQELRRAGWTVKSK